MSYRPFGWDLPPGVTHKMIDDQFGAEGPLDCPICADGNELDTDADLDPFCPTHGKITAALEAQRVYCAGPSCGNYIRGGVTPIEHDGKKFCSDACLRDYQTPVIDDYDGDEADVES
jgi:hypothetical protein